MSKQHSEEKKHRKDPQNFVTICSVIGGPYKERPALEERVRMAIERLGNPARPDIQDRLKKIRGLHFISVHVVKGQGRIEPSYLLLEMSVDGSKEHAIADLCLHMGEALFPIYQLAKCVKSKSKFEHQLLRDSVEIMQSMWPEFYHGNRRNGLEFSGTAGLEVHNIHDDETLANYARDVIDREVHVSGDSGQPTLKDKSPYLTPYKIFSHVAEKLKQDELPDDVKEAWDGVCTTCDTPNFAETSSAVWKKVWDIPTIIQKAVPASFFGHLAWIFLGIASLVWIALNGGTSMGGNPAFHVSEISAAKDGFYFSPKFVITGVLLSLLAAGVIDTLIRHWNRPGAVFWFTGAFAVFFGLKKWTDPMLAAVKNAEGVWPKVQTFFAQLWVKAELGFHYVADGVGLLPQVSVHSALAVAIIILTFILLFIKKGRDFVTFILSVTIFFALLYIVHHHFMVLRDSGVTVQNRWSGAGLPELVFYPLALTVVLTSAFYSAVTHAPRTVHRWAQIPLDTLAAILERMEKDTAIVAKAVAFFRSQKIYLFAFAGFFIWTFSQTFFPLADGQNVVYYIWPFLKKAIIYPLISASFIYWVYLFTDKTLYKNRRSGKARHIKPMILLFTLAFVVINYNVIASGGLRIASSLALAIPLMIIGLLMLAGILWLWLRSSERANKPEDFNPDIDSIQSMLTKENTNLAQNHMISVQRLLPQNFRRRFALPMGFLVLLKILKSNRFRPGFLSHMGTVQYARWIHLPNTNNYIFLSNYDGSWESYLEDFITKASSGLGIAWSHCKGFPSAKGIVLDGASDGDRFKRWARRSMQATPFWYSAYPELSSEEIRRNALIRDGLVKGELSPSDASAWLDLFHSMPRPENHIQTDKIQNILFGGSGKLRAGGCIAITRDDADKPAANFNDWIKAVSGEISFGMGRPGTQASYIALSSDGFKELGLEDTLDTDTTEENDPTRFSTAFAMGMNHEARKHILRDIGKNAPDKWTWGGNDNPVLAVLLVYGLETKHYKAQLKRLTETGAAKLSDYNLKIAYETKFDDLGEGIAVEPFGFADGISQPIIEGTKDGLSSAKSIHLVKPGEFILGYRDNRGYFPPSPQVCSQTDKSNVLPSIPVDLPQRYPKFPDEQTLKAQKRDLGRNGSYLVIRHLEQDKPTFDRNRDEAAAYLLKLRTMTPKTTDALKLPQCFAGKTIRELSLDQLHKGLEVLAPKGLPKTPSELKTLMTENPEQVQANIEKVNKVIRDLRIREITEDLKASDPSGNWNLAKVEKDYKQREARWREAIPELMIGRKKNGQSLVSCPHRITKASGAPIDVELGIPKDATIGVPEELQTVAQHRFLKEDNEFLLGRDDPQGHACPYGSHVRRSNPRDGLNLENEEALTISNRHRILRRGRAYTDPKTKAQGTFFICLNADIERQFEFIQQTWVASPKFHGLSEEVDPITAQGIDHNFNDQPHNQKFTIQAPLGDLKIGGLSSYVTLRGGGYYFLPSLDTLRFLAEER